MATSTTNIQKILELTGKIRPILAGNPAPVQGAVLADLLALWLAGHAAPDNDGATEILRERVLEAHLKTVRELIPVNYQMYVKRRRMQRKRKGET
jgi:hypothetical protein